MKIHLPDPSKAVLVDWPPELLQKMGRDLAYVDKKVEYAVKREKDKLARHQMGQHVWEIVKYGTDHIIDKIKALTPKINATALYHDTDHWVHSGYASTLAQKYNCEITKDFEYPKIGKETWTAETRTPREYQKRAVDLLVEANHGAVSLATGTGKTLCMTLLLKHYNLPALIIAPTTNIAKQILHELQRVFTKKLVGQFFGNKKESGKKFVVGIGKGMTLLKEGTEHYQCIAHKKVFIADESHTLGAETLQDVCMGLCRYIPYRFFFSGTQMRGDGLEPVLNGIIGPIVVSYDTKQGINDGVLTPPRFIQFESRSDALQNTKDPLKITRTHVYENRYLAKQACWLANKAVSNNHKVLILVDEVDQFLLVHPLLEHDHKFAYGTMSPQNRKAFRTANIPNRYFKSDPTELVEDFDKNLFPILIGTSCIGMGTDFQTPDFIIDLQGGASEIRLRQAIGRGVRRAPNKTEFFYVDFIIANIGLLVKQAQTRRNIMETIGNVKHKVLNV